MTVHRVANLSAWDAAVLDARRLVSRAQHCSLQQLADGFDHYNTPSQNYTVSGSVSISSSYRRFAPPSGCPGQGIFFAGGSFSTITWNLNSNQPTLIIKVAVKFPSYGSAATYGNPFLALTDGSGVQCQLRLLQTGMLAVSRSGDSGPLVAQSAAGLIELNVFYGLEIELSVSTSSGIANLWKDGAQLFSASAIDTQSTANAYAAQVQLGDISNRFTSGLYADDYRIWDNTGTTQNAPLGPSLQDSRLITKLPSAAGAFAQFTPNGASANWQCVDDNPPDGDTTYVSGSTAGLQDAYDMPTAGFSEAPVAVTAVAMARKDDAGARQLAIGVDSAGHTAVGSTATLASTYAFIESCIPEDPNTSAAWTAAGADGAEFYMEEIA